MPDLRTFRPTGVMAVAYGVVVVLVVLTIAVGTRLPEGAEFTTAQTATIWALIGVVAVIAHAVGRSKVRADDEGLEVVNGFRRRHVAWTDVAGISMNPGAPWPTLVTRDDERIILFAIQGSDGSAAREAVVWLRGHCS